MAILRFAPSPNGRLHLGHAYSALLNEQIAAQLGGTMLLRIEDIDSTRCTAELTHHCFDDLRWLGLHWPEPVRVQSQHRGDYQAALDKLKQRGLLYPCFCSRSEVAQRSSATDPDGAPIYASTCRALSVQGHDRRMKEPHSWRIDMSKAVSTPLHYRRFDRAMQEEKVPAEPARWGDAIIARKDIGTSYHLAVVVDDALQQITHVVRGKDLEAATDLHVLLQQLLQLPIPHYHHHELVTAPEGDKLAKSRGSESLASLRTRGLTPQQVGAMLPLSRWGVSPL